MNILVVDDEPLARARLQRLIAAMPAHRCIGEAADGEQALALCQRLRPDVVLLDIRMPGMDGMATARALAAVPGSPTIVFTTAYPDFAVQAFDAGAVHYLLKPVVAARLAQALERITPPLAPSLLLQRGASSQRVLLADVLYMQADAKYLTVHTVHGQWLLEESLANMEQRFAPRLLRVHRSLLINAQRLRAVHRDTDGHAWAEVEDVSARLPVSRRLLGVVQRQLEGR
ncbi:LytR/AlgR family response regulator transcription factor [Immundisolibacter sp.]|uniref:LytR/AlgR family response regulator transcription factor n=1 Tax=Immundisolibacter sp. TaxID=1934948 RepID=UPI0035676201